MEDVRFRSTGVEFTLYPEIRVRGSAGDNTYEQMGCGQFGTKRPTVHGLVNRDVVRLKRLQRTERARGKVAAAGERGDRAGRARGKAEAGRVVLVAPSVGLGRRAGAWRRACLTGPAPKPPPFCLSVRVSFCYWGSRGPPRALRLLGSGSALWLAWGTHGLEDLIVWGRREWQW